jgi:hypothetical protein
MMKKILLTIIYAAIIATTYAQTSQPKDTPILYSFNFRDASLDAVLQNLQSISGKSITVDLGISTSISIKTTNPVTKDEAIALIAHALVADGILLEDLDESTIRVRGTPTMSTIPKSDQRRPDYAELRRQRQLKRHGAVMDPEQEYTKEEVDKYWQDKQMWAIRNGLPPLPSIRLTAENANILINEGFVLPASLQYDSIMTHTNGNSSTDTTTDHER